METKTQLEVPANPLDFDATSLVEETPEDVETPTEKTETVDNDGIETIEDEPTEDTPDDGIDPITDEDENADNPLSLSEEAKAGMTPEALKRYEQHVAGVVKTESKLKEREEAIAGQEQRLTALSTWDQGLSTKETYADTVKRIVDLGEKMHGLSAADIFKTVEEPAPSDDFEFGTDKILFDKATAEARSLSTKAKAEAVSQAKQEILDEMKSKGVDMDALGNLLKNQSTTKQKADTEAKAKDLLPRVMKTLQMNDGGWKPDAAKVEQVLAQNPTLLDKPSTALIDAVRIALRKDRDAYLAGTPSEKGIEALRSGKGTGKAMPSNPMDVTAAMLLGLSDD